MMIYQQIKDNNQMLNHLEINIVNKRKTTIKYFNIFKET